MAAPLLPLPPTTVARLDHGGERGPSRSAARVGARIRPHLLPGGGFGLDPVPGGESGPHLVPSGGSSPHLVLGGGSGILLPSAGGSGILLPGAKAATVAHALPLLRPLLSSSAPPPQSAAELPLSLSLLPLLPLYSALTAAHRSAPPSDPGGRESLPASSSMGSRESCAPVPSEGEGQPREGGRASRDEEAGMELRACVA
ncbi:uncharacterized protein [Miscanthus floridulus]|uniref:uncharacterized protein n=1 Tax=Miscanthus floridulus TaxID=154761 RepID=UPI0034575272